MSLKMKGDVLDELVRRLRSGEYQQGQSALRLRGGRGRPDTYCCLGILCEIAVENGVVDRSLAQGSTAGAYWYGGDIQGSDIYLPNKVVDWAGIESVIEKEIRHDYFYEQRGQWGEAKEAALSVMNDEGAPFDEIADWLEANVERV